MKASNVNALGIVGLGRMGGGLALLALEKGMRVVGYSKGGASADLKQAGLIECAGLSDFSRLLEAPRCIILYVPAGKAVDAILDELSDCLGPDDVLADGGNSYWGDSVRRYERLRDRARRFVDVGTSGGVSGARRGACFMVGGEKEAVATLEPLLHPLAVEGGYVHAGPPGAGHFVKLVHNGIEFGMMQAMAEGVDLLGHHPAPLDIAGTLECWRHGSVIRSWLMDLLAEAYKADPLTEKASGYVEDTGEVNWLIEDALRMEVPVPVIAQSVMQLFLSRDESKVWARAIASMRHAFGGHPFGRDKRIAEERRTSRVGESVTPPT